MGCDPVDSMVRIARIAEEANAHQLAVKIYSDLLQYAAPKLKAVELTGNLNVTPGLEMLPHERLARIKALAAELGMEVREPLVIEATGIEAKGVDADTDTG